MASTKAAEPTQSAEGRRWEVEDAVRTLSRAEQIKSDPKLMKDVRVLAKDLQRVVEKASPRIAAAAPAVRKDTKAEAAHTRKPMGKGKK